VFNYIIDLLVVI